MSYKTNDRRTFTVIDGDDETTYNGVNRQFAPAPQHVVLLLIDGEIDLFALDDPDDLGGLDALLDSEPVSHVKRLGVYSLRGEVHTGFQPLGPRLGKA